MAAAVLEPWALGTSILDSYDPCKNQVEERLYRDLLHCEYRRFGSGTLHDSFIVRFRQYDSDRGCRWVRLHHAVVTAVANHFSMRCVWICAAAHDEEFVRTDLGARIPDAWHADGSFKKFATRKTVYHITFRLGDSPYHCHFAAHAYVEVDAEKMSVGFLRGGERIVRRDGAPPVDVWSWTGSVGFQRTLRRYQLDFDYPSYHRPGSRYSTESFCGKYLPELCGVCHRNLLDGIAPPRPKGGVPLWRQPNTRGEPTLETCMRIQLYGYAYATYRARHRQLAAEFWPLEADFAALRSMHWRHGTPILDIWGEHHALGQSYC